MIRYGMIERKEIIDNALKIYLSKRRRVQLDDICEEPAMKKTRTEIEDMCYGKETCEWIDGSGSEDEEDE